MFIESYPLYWPEGWPRTEKEKRTHSRFHVTFGQARDGLIQQVKLLAGPNCSPILSTNIPLRRDGLPYAHATEPDDPGVAIYFDYKGQHACLACDKWKYTRDNIRAIEKSIEALRGIDRWGASTILDRAFQGFTLLANPDPNWWDVLDVNRNDSLEFIEGVYRAKIKQCHPDLGGDAEQARQLNEAIKTARAVKGK